MLSMKVLVVFGAVVSFAFANISVIAPQKSPPASRGEVPNIGNCGSSGKIWRVMVDGCDTNPCFFSPDTWIRMTVVFEPADPSNTLWFRGWFYDFEDHFQYFFNNTVPGALFPGTTYHVGANAYFPTDLAATRGFVQLQVWDNSFQHPVGCAEFEALVGNK